MKISNGQNYNLKKDIPQKPAAEFKSITKRPTLRIFNTFVNKNRTDLTTKINTISEHANVQDKGITSEEK